MEFHEKLQELRKQHGMTQEELAAALYVSRTAVSKWESGRGYPNIDSLKRIASLFAVTVDELLSGDELLSLAETDHRRQQHHVRDLVFGLLDMGAALLLFLPFFAQKADGVARAVSLLLWAPASPYVRIIYLVLVAGMVISGLLALALQTCQRRGWLLIKRALSLFWHTLLVLALIIGSQPYAAGLLFVFLIIKLSLIIKHP